MATEAADEKRSASLRRRLVRELASGSVIRSKAIRAAFLAVPRELFLPTYAAQHGLEAVYRDEAIPTKWDARRNPISSSSQPAIMAEMLERLELAPGQRVLEIGAGTGYNAALLSHIVGPAGEVTTVDVDLALARSARAALRRGGYPVTVVTGDGRDGHARSAPYDRIVATASADTVPQAWFDQLREGGLVEVPLRLTADGGQRIPTLRKENGSLRSVAIVRGGFMPLRHPEGEASGPRWPPSLSAWDGVTGPKGALAVLSGESLRGLSAAARRRLLLVALEPARRHRLGFRVEAESILWYLSLTLPPARAVTAGPGWKVGLLSRDGRSLAYVGARDHDGVGRIGELHAHGGPAAEEELAAAIHVWNQRGRPGLGEYTLHVTYPDEPRLGHTWTPSHND